MNDDAVQKAVLEKLYRVRSETPRAIYNLHDFGNEIGVERETLWRNWQYLKEKGLTKAVALGGSVQITDFGFLTVEKLGVAPKDLTRENNRVRVKILQALTKLLEDRGAMSVVDWTGVVREADITENQFHSNIGVLDCLGFIEWMGRRLRLTASGWDKVREIQERFSIADEFEAIEALPPQQRGRELEKVLEKVLVAQDWSVQRDVRPETEQLDLVAHRAREYYMLECKWEKDPIEAGVVRELASRLRKRVGVHGILLSMSGFTGGAIAEAKTFLMERLILLFDRSDVEAVVYGQRSFDELLTGKFDAAVVRGEIIVGANIAE